MATTKETRVTLRCDMCAGSLRPGLLWLGGKDYVECPQCGGDQKMPVVERLTTPGLLFAVTR